MHTDSTDTTSQPPSVLRCTSTADFLAVLPFVTGFTDESSLFIVLFRGNRGENVIRLPLPAAMLTAGSVSHATASRFAAGKPPSDAQESVNAMFDLVHELLDTTGAGGEGPAFVITTPLSFDECKGVPHLRLARRLERRVNHAGWRLREFAVVASDGWTSLLSSRPETRRELSEIAASPLIEQARSATDSPQTLREMSKLPVRSARRADRVAALLTQVRARSSHDPGTASLPLTAPASRTPAWVREVTQLSEACFSSEPPRTPEFDRDQRTSAHGGEHNGESSHNPPSSANAPHTATGGPSARKDRKTDVRSLARLIDAVQTPDRWLVVALTALTRPQFVMSLAHENGTRLFGSLSVSRDPVRLRSSIEEVLLTLSFEQPRSNRLRRVTHVLADAAAHAPRDAAPGVLSLLAWTWWMLGMQSIAQAFLDLSHEIDPDHELTQMVGRLLMCPPESRLRALRADREAAAA